jgi:hypothetical protein
MKKAKNMLVFATILTLLLGFQACKAGCGCPKFSTQQQNPNQ